MEHGVGPHGNRPAVRIPDDGEAVHTTAGDLVQLVDHPLELALHIHGATIDERDRACGHADTLLGGRTAHQYGSMLGVGVNTSAGAGSPASS